MGFLSLFKQAGGRAAAGVADFLFPPLCLSCDAPVAQNQSLCADCWKALHFVAPPFCACCGGPFDIPVEEGGVCGACLARPPVFTMARSALVYNDASKPLLLRFKHADRLHPAPALASWMIRAAGPLLQEADILVPVPLHRWRLLKRRYNQAAILAQQIGRQTRKNVQLGDLLRVRATASQGHLSGKERASNVEGAFSVRQGAKLAGQKVLLIDDVLTSGATVNECARCLLDAGAAQVAVLTLARVRGAQ